MSQRVLIADDDEDIRAYLELTLSLAGYDVLEAADGATAVECCVSDPPDVVLLDVMMPRLDGLEVLRRLREDVRTSHVPVLLVTAKVQREDILEGLAAGADDYVTKPFDAEVLLARVEAALRRSEQVSARNPLTGLPGNTVILAELNRRVSDHQQLALLYIDLDRFKPFNDHYGFLRGDQALRALADVLRGTVAGTGPEVFLGHVGGDDFVVICPPAQAEELATRICMGFDAVAPGLYDPSDRAAGGIEVPDRRGVPTRFGLLSLSIGIATSDRRDYDHPGEVVTVATEMKRYAKTRTTPGSAYQVDRRIDGETVDLEVELP